MKKNYFFIKFMPLLSALLMLPLQANAGLKIAACFVGGEPIIPINLIPIKEFSAKSCIDISAVNYGVNKESVVNEKGDLSLGHAQFQNLTIQKAIDASTPSLFLNMLQGSPYTSVTLNFYDFTGTGELIRYLILTLEKVATVNISTAVASGDALANTESISFMFTKITTTVSTFDDKGKIIESPPACWDLETDKTC